VGKTTLAREGLSKILVDDAKVPRPFHMIALGTATTGSTLVGHNYTYQGSQWGDIVRILMESECMNPIIYIDELDKVSQTENGKEIIGILTHLTDPAQNEEFQDRYFAGVKLDMSRVLFVFSYNNPELIDPILLDRIHRVHFTSLATYEKMEIVRDYTIPEIAKTLNLSPDVMKISDETLRYVIENYTYEAGVRKLREILLDTFREVNLQEIMEDDCGWLEEREGMGIREPKGVEEGMTVKKMIFDEGMPLDFIESRILHRRSRANHRKADTSRTHNRVYGMFATERGMGGILPIRIDQDITAKDVSCFPVEITGQLGDVMKESVKISRTVAIRLLGKVPAMGLHIHFPEGAVKKDGPSAGGAITLAIWSFVSKIPIPGDTAITGEIDLDGRILPVGGIREKMLGSVRDGIRRVILPEDNRRDYDIAFGEIPKGECPMEIVFVRHIDEIISIFRDGATEQKNIREDTNYLFDEISGEKGREREREGDTEREREREKEICHMLDMVSTCW
jgi:ATP-dependent Lon protease